MKRKILIPVMILVLTTMACSLSGVTQSVSEIGKQELVTPTSAPTNTPIPEKAVEKSFYDDFSSSQEGWSDLVVVTTQAIPGQMQSNAKMIDGKMVFGFSEKETYLYKFYENPAPDDVVIEVKEQATGHTENGIALVCRAKNDHSAWYEFRVSSLNQYAIYRYDQSQRESGGNPYIQLKKGGLQIDQFGPTKENIIRVTCKGSTLSLTINDKEITSIEDGELSGGLAGVGAMSGTLLPVGVRFDHFSYGQP